MTDYIDVHCSRFTLSSFELIIDDLRNLGLIDFSIISRFKTEGCEFYITLGKKEKFGSNASRFDILKKINSDLFHSDPSYLKDLFSKKLKKIKNILRLLKIFQLRKYLEFIYH